MRRSLYFRSILFEIFGQVLMYQFQLFCFLLKGNVFTEDVINAWINYKMANEVKAMALRPHPFEFQLYYDV